MKSIFVIVCMKFHFKPKNLTVLLVSFYGHVKCMKRYIFTNRVTYYTNVATSYSQYSVMCEIFPCSALQGFFHHQHTNLLWSHRAIPVIHLVSTQKSFKVIVVTPAATAADSTQLVLLLAFLLLHILVQRKWYSSSNVELFFTHRVC